QRPSVGHLSWSASAPGRPAWTGRNVCTWRAPSRRSTAKPLPASARSACTWSYAKRERRPVSSQWSAWNATKPSPAPGPRTRPARSMIASDTQRWAVTRSGAKAAYSPASASSTTNSTLVRRPWAARTRASSMAAVSRSRPITRRQRGASSSASRPAPVPTSSTTFPASPSPISSASSLSKLVAGGAPASDRAVGDQTHRGPEAGALERARDVEHLPHAGPALGALVADDDHVARLDRPRLDGGEGVLFAFEDARRAPEDLLLVPGHLRHAAVRGQVTAEDGHAAVRGDRLRERPDHLL